MRVESQSEATNQIFLKMQEKFIQVKLDFPHALYHGISIFCYLPSILHSL